MQKKAKLAQTQLQTSHHVLWEVKIFEKFRDLYLRSSEENQSNKWGTSPQGAHIWVFPTIFEPKFLMYKAFENKGSGSWIVTIKPSTLFQIISELKFVVCREFF